MEQRTVRHASANPCQGKGHTEEAAAAYADRIQPVCALMMGLDRQPAVTNTANGSCITLLAAELTLTAPNSSAQLPTRHQACFIKGRSQGFQLSHGAPRGRQRAGEVVLKKSPAKFNRTYSLSQGLPLYMILLLSAGLCCHMSSNTGMGTASTGA
jgi:hypothetical protein